MTITIPPELETRIRGRAEAEGVTVEKYVERLLRADQHAEDELAALAIEGITSGKPFEVGPNYWESQHRRLDEHLKKFGIQ
jgi:hypothetical protein